MPAPPWGFTTGAEVMHLRGGEGALLATVCVVVLVLVLASGEGAGRCRSVRLLCALQVEVVAQGRGGSTVSASGFIPMALPAQGHG